MRSARVGVFTLMVLAASLTFAQTPAPDRPRPSPEETQRIMQAALGAVGPMMGQMAEAMIQSQLKIAEKPETADSIATFKRNLYDSLMKKGFKANEALQIVVATGLPAASASR